MCIICVSRSGVRQPGEATIRAMFLNNPHGAGYMFARDGWVTIHKGFMDLDDYLRAIREEHFTVSDNVVYHFRISTQDGCVAVFYGSPDGSDDAVLSPEAFSERFEITAIND